MKNLSENLKFTVPITLEAHHLAEKFSFNHCSSDKTKQIYLNTLAVYAVRLYLNCMGIETNWEASLSWEPIIQTLLDVADLEVPGLGKIECRPVLPGDNVVSIPLEVCLDRIAYIAVQINESRKQATLLGFCQTPTESGEVPISELQSLEEMLSLLDRSFEVGTQIKSQEGKELSSQNMISEITFKEKPVQLKQWFKDIYEFGWETVESLLNSQQQFELAFRSINLQEASANPPSSINHKVERGKVLDFRQNSETEQVALLVELNMTSENEINIWVKVCPHGEQKFLPEELQLMVLDERGIAVMQAIARQTENIQLNFSSQPEESFSLKVVLGTISFTEFFQC